MSIKHETFAVDRGNAYSISAIFDSFIRLERANSLAAKALSVTSFHDELDAGHSHWLAGTLFISAQIAALVDDLVDFDAWNEQIGGVFTYEHLEFQEGKAATGCRSLPAFLWVRLSRDAWYQAVCNYVEIDDVLLELFVRQWALDNNVPLKDGGVLDPEELEAKYGREHPSFTRAMWQVAVQQGATDAGYWDWVAGSIEGVV